MVNQQLAVLLGNCEFVGYGVSQMVTYSPSHLYGSRDIMTYIESRVEGFYLLPMVLSI